MSEKGKLARSLFEQGYNCCQSVVGAYAREMGLDLAAAMRLSSALGGGVSRLRETCGAVSGMAVVAGMLYGYSSPSDPEEKRRTYALMQELGLKFKEKSGSLVCRELLNLPEGASDPAPERRTEAYYQKRPCAALVEYAADLLSELCEREGARL